MLLTSRTVIVATFQVMVGVFLVCWSATNPPFSVEAAHGANVFRFTLDAGALWMFATSWVATVWVLGGDASEDDVDTRTAVLTVFAGCTPVVMGVVYYALRAHACCPMLRPGRA